MLRQAACRLVRSQQQTTCLPDCRTFADAAVAKGEIGLICGAPEGVLRREVGFCMYAEVVQRVWCCSPCTVRELLTRNLSLSLFQPAALPTSMSACVFAPGCTVLDRAPAQGSCNGVGTCLHSLLPPTQLVSPTRD